MEQKQEKLQLELDIGTIDEIIHNYVELEQSMVSQLFFKYKNNGSTIGGFREDIWRELFVQIVPKKFVVEQSVFIIDSKGHVSPEVDLVILDEIYTPYIFRKGRLKFIPIEAVAVAIECKSLSASYESLETWTDTIKGLKTSRESVARMHGYIATGDMNGKSQTQTATRPILIYCCLDDKHSKNMELFDFTLQADSEQRKIHIHRKEEIRTLDEWYHALNHHDTTVDQNLKYDAPEKLKASIDNYQVKSGTDGEEREVSLLSFNFQLNQLLMLVNNPMLFPHMAYVDLFNKKYI
ncbi:DUF6602 domain-containing protein [Paenibacillus larvae]|uniref:DUF6602 domain-containing protein n=2 Tax=Paenibacillus larvae TaxID=1464 RepID=A0AAP5JSF2_9BACL|nr:DUF6602 domain-containing protein [Paenibacillus larvae]AQR79051.1 hypothetical protein BXP28_19235 [Paenibacillus larvae subsp. larvae]AVF23852.1 hypothetical protein ERICI_04128 [Paenibacillus larvae subsp. larvae]ETK29480.1 hypothetical protein ERIC1_1c30320 [Paenibacillus larvae subsp. larvae DSM 25719]MCY7475744.1 hypothetical protein [Paenibacillus larvae]MCY7488688.1 hypothetical protein [Paenibacillus larvae]